MSERERMPFCSVEVAGSHSDTLGSFPLEECLVRRRDIIQPLQKTDIHAHCEIRTRNPSKRAAADPRLRPRRLRGRPKCFLGTMKTDSLAVWSLASRFYVQ